METNKVLRFLPMALLGLMVSSCNDEIRTETPISDTNKKIKNPILVAEGQETFRHETFGDEDFWSGVLHIDNAIKGEQNGGYGPGVSPATALSVGLKVDTDALPSNVASAIKNGKVDLNSPATTLTLLKSNAVVGLKGNFDSNGAMTSVGITCALCHSTVDNSFGAGMGKRLDGWPNRDLNVGVIVSLTDNAAFLANLLHVSAPTVVSVLQGWGPGKFNAGLLVDGKALKPDGTVAANLIPAAFGMQGVNLATYTGWGDLTYWNAFVANIEMHGKGTFSDSRLNDPIQFPIAVENNFGNIMNTPDLITPKLPGLQAYQLSIPAPTPPSGSYNSIAAASGKVVFEGAGKCATCHVPPILTDAGFNMHAATEIGIDDFEAKRSPTGMYRTTPLRGLFARSKGGFYHDGRFADLDAVIAHYDNHMNLQLTSKQKSDLREYLKSL